MHAKFECASTVAPAERRVIMDDGGSLGAAARLSFVLVNRLRAEPSELRQVEVASSLRGSQQSQPVAASCSQ